MPQHTRKPTKDMALNPWKKEEKQPWKKLSEHHLKMEDLQRSGLKLITRDDQPEMTTNILYQDTTLGSVVVTPSYFVRDYLGAEKVDGKS